MSNYLSIATVTAGLVQTLQAAVEADVPGATVTTIRPDGAGGGTPNKGANLYLFQVTPNAAGRNADLPTRGSNGQLVQRPRVALDLHYLVTFYGDENQLEPQRVLGSVVRTLHARPLLTREVIRQTINANPVLAESNLADEAELVKFTPIGLSLEELSKLWSVFFQIPYTLSVAYQGTVVFIESEETPRAVLPVLERDLKVMPFRQPIIEEIKVRAGPNEPIVDGPIILGNTLVVRGKQLRGDDTQLRIAGLTGRPQQVTDTEISLPLKLPDTDGDSLEAGVPDVDSLRAGMQGMQVVHRLLLGRPPTPHGGFESNIAPFVLRPTIRKRPDGTFDITIGNQQGSGNAPRSADITVKVNPKIGKQQRVILLMNEISDDSPRAYTFFANPRDADSDSVTIPVSSVKAADYLVRIQVDGAESVLQVSDDPDNPKYVEPKVTIA